MGLKYNKQAQRERDELLADWTDVYGFNYDYGWFIPDPNGEIDNVTIGFNVTSLRNEGEEQNILLVMDPTDACFLVEDFLNVYKDLYLNHITKRARNEQEQTND